MIFFVRLFKHLSNVMNKGIKLEDTHMIKKMTKNKVSTRWPSHPAQYT